MLTRNSATIKDWIWKPVVPVGLYHVVLAFGQLIFQGPETIRCFSATRHDGTLARAHASHCEIPRTNKLRGVQALNSLFVCCILFQDISDKERPKHSFAVYSCNPLNQCTVQFRVEARIEGGREGPCLHAFEDTCVAYVGSCIE